MFTFERGKQALEDLEHVLLLGTILALSAAGRRCTRLCTPCFCEGTVVLWCYTNITFSIFRLSPSVWFVRVIDCSFHFAQSGL